MLFREFGSLYVIEFLTSDFWGSATDDLNKPFNRNFLDAKQREDKSRTDLQKADDELVKAKARVTGWNRRVAVLAKVIEVSPSLTALSDVKDFETFKAMAKKLMLNASFLDYRMPVCLDLPMIATVIVEVPNPHHPYGMRGVGETSVIPPLAAITNAVYHAIGIRLHRLPLSPARILEALWEKEAAANGTHAK